MKNNAFFHLLTISVFALSLLTFGNCHKKQVPASSEHMTQQDTMVMYAQAGDTFVILLNAQMGTGFRWMIEGAPNPGITLLQEEQITLEDQSDVQRFQFRAETPGAYDLLFVYRRPWEKKPLADLRQKAYHIIVKS